MCEYHENLDIIYKAISDWLDNPDNIEVFKTDKKAFSRQHRPDVAWSFKKTFLAILLSGSTDNLKITNNFYDMDILDQCVGEASFRAKRQLINSFAFNYVNFIFAQIFFSSRTKVKRLLRSLKYMGHFNFAVDTSIITLPKRQEFYDIFGGQNQKGVLIPQARVSIIYDVISGIILDVILSPSFIDERTLLRVHLKTIATFGIPADKIIILADRGYPAEYIFYEIECYGFKYLFRVPKEYNRKTRNAAEIDQIVEYNKKKNKIKKQRIIQFKLSSGQEECLVTNIYDESLTARHFYKWYAKRWKIETTFNFIKNLYGKNTNRLSNENTNTIEQMLYSSILLHNLSTLVVKITDKRISGHIHSGNFRGKYNGKTNRTNLFNVTKWLIVKSIFTKCVKRLINKVLGISISDIFLSIRPGRDADRYEIKEIRTYKEKKKRRKKRRLVDTHRDEKKKRKKKK